MPRKASMCSHINLAFLRAYFSQVVVDAYERLEGAHKASPPSYDPIRPVITNLIYPYPYPIGITTYMDHHLGPGPTWALGPLGPWAHLGPGPTWALGPLGPGPTWALGPLGPWACL